MSTDNREDGEATGGGGGGEGDEEGSREGRRTTSTSTETQDRGQGSDGTDASPGLSDVSGDGERAGPGLRGHPLAATLQSPERQATSFPSWLEYPCEIPSDLFHTLTPFTASRMLGRSMLMQSTPHEPRERGRGTRRDPHLERSEPMGGEDPISGVTAAMARVGISSGYFAEVSEEESESGRTRDRTRPLARSERSANARPPLVGESAAATGLTASLTSVADSESTERDSLAERVEVLLTKTKRKGDVDFFLQMPLPLNLFSADEDAVDSEADRNLAPHEVIEAGRSEPDGKGRRIKSLSTQPKSVVNTNDMNKKATDVKLVYYSSSESESESEETSKSSQVSLSSSSQTIATDTQHVLPPLAVDRISPVISYAVRGEQEPSFGEQSGNFGDNSGNYKAPASATHQPNDPGLVSLRESIATQTVRSFLGEQAQGGLQPSIILQPSVETVKSSEPDSRRDSVHTNSSDQDLQLGPTQTGLNTGTFLRQPNIYIPTGKKQDGPSNQNSSDGSSGVPLDRGMNVLKSSFSTNSVKSTSSSEGQKENKPMKPKQPRTQSRQSQSSVSASHGNILSQVPVQRQPQNNDKSRETKRKEIDSTGKKDAGTDIVSGSNRSSPANTVHSVGSTESKAQSSPSIGFVSKEHEKEFKNLVEKQRNYLKCLQRELSRLEKMERVFSKMHQKSCKFQARSSKQRVLPNSETRDDGEADESSTPCTVLSRPPAGSHNRVSSKNASGAKSSCPSSAVPTLSPTSGTSTECCGHRTKQWDYDSDRSASTSRSSLILKEAQLRCKLCNSHLHQHHPRSQPTPPQQTHSRSTNNRLLTQKQSPGKKRRERDRASNVGDMRKPVLKDTKVKDVEKVSASVAIQTSESLLRLNQINDNTKLPTNVPHSQSNANEVELMAWFVPLAPNSNSRLPSKRQLCKCCNRRDHQQTPTITNPISLQDAFEQKCGKVLKRSERRANYIHTKALVRRNTAEERFAATARAYEKIATMGRIVSKSSQDVAKAAAAMKPKTVLTQKEMRTRTERMYTSLPEVTEKKKREKVEEEVKTYRLMANIYTNRLKENALKGRITWPLTRNCNFN